MPTGTATFGASNTTTLTLYSSSSPSGVFDGWTLNAGASNYTFNTSIFTAQEFTGSGITINGGSAGHHQRWQC